MGFGAANHWAPRLGLIDHYPLTPVESVRAGQAPLVAYTAKEAAALYPQVGALDRGLRRGELLGLRWEDIDLEG